MNGLKRLAAQDTTKPNAEQGLFRKFDVRRTDGSDFSGGKHDGCEYFVLDVTHDQHAKAALTAYADACEPTHPMLAVDLRARYALAKTADADHAALLARVEAAEADAGRYRWLRSQPVTIDHGRIAPVRPDKLDAMIDREKASREPDAGNA